MMKSVVLMIGAMLSLLSCGTKAPKGELVGLKYTTVGTMAGYQYEGRIEQRSDTTFILTAMKMNYGTLYQKRIGMAEMARLKKIIIEEKMYKYKRRYRPIFTVKDGHSWYFYAEFSDGMRIYSNGENATPGGNGLIRVLNALNQMIEDATEEVPDSLRKD